MEGKKSPGRVVFAVLTLQLISACLVQAQSAHRTDGSPESNKTKINIVDVEFRQESSLPEDLRTVITEELKKSAITIGPEDGDDDWISELSEVTVGDVLRNRGYYKEYIEMTPYLERVEPRARFYAVSLAAQSGPQYRLNALHIVESTVFSEAQLIAQTRLNTGDIFDVSKVRDGLEEMRRRYARKGYIDCTIEPTIKLDDEKNLIDLTLRVQEERAYRVRNFEIFGLDENTRNRLSSQLPLAPGEIFNADSVREFFAQNPSFLPREMSFDKIVSVRRNLRDSEVDIVFDFRTLS